MGAGHHDAVTTGVGRGDRVLVIGDGVVGLSAVIAVNRLGAEQIVLMGGTVRWNSMSMNPNPGTVAIPPPCRDRSSASRAPPFRVGVGAVVSGGPDDRVDRFLATILIVLGGLTTAALAAVSGPYSLLLGVGMVRGNLTLLQVTASPTAGAPRATVGSLDCSRPRQSWRLLWLPSPEQCSPRHSVGTFTSSYSWPSSSCRRIHRVLGHS